MQIKAGLKGAALPLLAIGLTAAAYLLAQWIPASARMDRWQKAVAELTPSAPIAEVCAVANVHFAVQLTREDVAVWQTLVQRGTPADEALRIVVTYARGRVK